jgi:[ribosomal protein S5]-alanine N-acetyltransferase
LLPLEEIQWTFRCEAAIGRGGRADRTCAKTAAVLVRVPESERLTRAPAYWRRRGAALGCSVMAQISRVGAFMNSAVTVIQGPRLDLIVLPGALLDACLANDLSRAHQLAEFALPDEFLGECEWNGIRRNQVLADPAWEPWSLRAIVVRGEQRMVGTTSFHGPPGINDLGTPGAAEIGYTVFTEFRGRGYATETCRAMLDWAHREHGVRHFISGIEPSNAPSIRVIGKLGFTSTGLMIDGETIFELRVP